MSGDDVHKLISIDDDVKNSVPIALFRLRSGSLLNTAVEVEVDKAVLLQLQQGRKGQCFLQ